MKLQPNFTSLSCVRPSAFPAAGSPRARPGVQKGLGATRAPYLLRPRIILAPASSSKYFCGRPAGFARPPAVAFSVMVFAAARNVFARPPPGLSARYVGTADPLPPTPGKVYHVLQKLLPSGCNARKGILVSATSMRPIIRSVTEYLLPPRPLVLPVYFSF